MKPEDSLLADILRYASRYMSSAGCNDTPSEWLAVFTDAELDDLHARMDRWNSKDPEEWGNYSRQYPAPDWFYAHYLEARLRGKA